jgi:hypothetical protein
VALARLRAPSGPACAAAGWTTGQWLETWLTGRQSLRPPTRSAYRQHLDCDLIPAIGQLPLAYSERASEAVAAMFWPTMMIDTKTSWRNVQRIR